MFQKLTVFSITGLPESAAALAERLQAQPFTPTTPNQAIAVGWVPPRAEHGTLVEAVAGHWIARFVIETRSVPGEAVKRRVAELVAEIERTTGRAPGRKEQRNLKDQAIEELLPKAFPKLVELPVWIDPTTGILGIGATTMSKADEAVTLLVKCVPDLAVQLAQTAQSPSVVMATWITEGEATQNFTVGNECELQAADESKAVVRYGRLSLDRADVREHIQQGKMPRKLGLTWSDRVALQLNDRLQLSKIEFLDAAMSGQQAEAEDSFDGSVAIACGELRNLLADLIEALGGQLLRSAGGAEAQAGAGDGKATQELEAADAAAA